MKTLKIEDLKIKNADKLHSNVLESPANSIARINKRIELGKELREPIMNEYKILTYAMENEVDYLDLNLALSYRDDFEKAMNCLKQ